jgi:tRNA (cytidine/uridine-2'-O-)-methyltransferase
VACRAKLEVPGCGVIALLHVALYEPEIPPNAGNIARLCAATRTRLHFIGRLGFHLDDKHLKRAGLDYWPHVDFARHATLDDFLAVHPVPWLVECPAPRPYWQAHFQDEDVLLFGRESTGLPPSVRERFAERLLMIPMENDAVRSLNLATSVGIVLYEARRQLHSR